MSKPVARSAKKEEIEQTGNKRKGFASMTETERRAASGLGGKNAQAAGKGHKFNSDSGSAAGRKGGQALSKNKQHMSDIGKKGGNARWRSMQHINGQHIGSASPGLNSTPGPYILIADGDKDGQHSLTENLQQYNCHLPVYVVESGYDVIKHLENNNNNLPVALMLAVNVPQINGMEVLKYLQTNTVLADIPAFIFTNHDGKERHKNCEMADHDGRYRKSMDFADMVKMVNEAASAVQDGSNNTGTKDYKQ